MSRSRGSYLTVDMAESDRGRREDDRRPAWEDDRRPPVVRPEKFDGKGLLNAYLQQFNMCAELNEWSVQDKAKFLEVKPNVSLMDCQLVTCRIISYLSVG